MVCGTLVGSELMFDHTKTSEWTFKDKIEFEVDFEIRISCF